MFPHNANQANEDNGGAQEERKEDLREAREARCEREKEREGRSAVKTKHKLGDFAQGGFEGPGPALYWSGCHGRKRSCL